jgi:ABC-type transport system involved in multi-copper enzyme maturation permease subunit
MLGPLFYYDLIQMGRKGRTIALRVAYVCTLFSVLYISYREAVPTNKKWTVNVHAQDHVDLDSAFADLARLANRFVHTILLFQTVAILVLTPAYIAPVIAAEKQRGTLDLLFTSSLSDRDIVFGKLLSRTLHLGLVLMAGLPLLALTQMWGGVGAFSLCSAFVASGLSLLSVAAICMVSSVGSSSVVGSLFVSYCATAIISFPCFCCSLTPVGIFDLMEPSASLYPLAIYTLVHGGIAAVCLSIATRNVRPTSGLSGLENPFKAGFSTHSVEHPRRSWPRMEELPLDDAKHRPRVGEYPLLWKEVYRGVLDSLARVLEREFRRLWPRVMCILPTLLALCAILSWLNVMPETLVALALVSACSTAFVTCVCIGFRSAGSLSREKDAATLDGLLLLPVNDWSIPGAKWLGAILSFRFFIYYLMATLLIAALCLNSFNPVVHPGGILLFAVAVATHAAFLASLGLRISLASRNIRQSQFIMAVFLLLFFGGGLSWLLGAVPERLMPSSWREPLASVGLSPVRTWFFFAFSWKPDWSGTAYAAKTQAAAFCLGEFALASVILFLDTKRCLGKERCR